MAMKSKYSRLQPTFSLKRKPSRKRDDYYRDDYKSSSISSHTRTKTDIHSIRNAAIESTGNPTSFYGVKSLPNSKRIFGDDKFNLYQHMKELFAETTTGDIEQILEYLKDSKNLTSNFLSNKVKYQYKEFIAMSRNVLEIEDQMSEMDDMLKSMSVSMRSLHETNFKMLQRQNNQLNGKKSNIGINEEEQRDREQQEIEALESMHEQIATHIQLRQLQQATDLIVTARNEQVHLKPSARKRAMNFIATHIHDLESLIVEQLSSTSFLPDLKRDKLSTLLMKLGFVDQAMELFLDYKSKSLKQTIRQISLYGDVKQYIQDLSKVFFDEIINTTIQYTNLLNKIETMDEEQREEEEEMLADAGNVNPFTMMRDRQTSTNPFDAIQEEKDDDEVKENAIMKNAKKPSSQRSGDKFSRRHSMHMSRLIVWIYKELETYEKLFEQQVFQLEQNDFRTIGECLKIVFKQSTRLDQSGIHVSFLLSNHFHSSIESAINRLYKKKLESIKKLSRKENYVSKSKNVSSAGNKNIKRVGRGLSVVYYKRKQLNATPASNPFTQTDRKRSMARFSRISRVVANASSKTGKHARRSSEIFGDVVNVQEKKQDNTADDDNKNMSGSASDDENMQELRKLSQRRMSKTKDDIKKALTQMNGSENAMGRQRSDSGSRGSAQFTVVKLTKSGQEMYEIVKKCIQETWRLLDQRYYSELTKSVYRTVVTQMIYLVQVYSSQITQEINDRAPKELTTYRRSLTASQQFGGHSMPKHKKQRSSGRHRRNSSKTAGNNVPTIKENEQFGAAGDDEKTKDTLQMPSSSMARKKKEEAPKVLNETQMLSLIANVYYVSEDLLTRIAQRYQKLFGREIPELEMFAIEQQKLYKAQFQQFAKKFLYKWVNEKFQWIDDRICSIYAEKADISIVTKEEIQSWSISKEMLGFVRYIVNLRLEIDKYLGANNDLVILRDSIEIFLTELYHGDYIPNASNMDKEDKETVIISPYGLHRLYLDFRFLMITLNNFMSSNSKQLCASICEKAKKYVNVKYNLNMEVDWKLMHTVGMTLQYKALTGDELDVLNKSFLSSESNNSLHNTAPTKKESGGATPKLSPTTNNALNVGSAANPSNPFG